MTSINVTGQQVSVIPPDPMVRTRCQQSRAAYRRVRRDPVPISPDLRVRNGPAAYHERYAGRRGPHTSVEYAETRCRSAPTLRSGTDRPHTTSGTLAGRRCSTWNSCIPYMVC